MPGAMPPSSHSQTRCSPNALLIDVNRISAPFTWLRSAWIGNDVPVMSAGDATPRVLARGGLDLHATGVL